MRTSKLWAILVVGGICVVGGTGLALWNVRANRAPPKIVLDHANFSRENDLLGTGKNYAELYESLVSPVLVTMAPPSDWRPGGLPIIDLIAKQAGGLDRNILASADNSGEETFKGVKLEGYLQFSQTRTGIEAPRGWSIIKQGQYGSQAPSPSRYDYLVLNDRFIAIHRNAIRKSGVDVCDDHGQSYAILDSTPNKKITQGELFTLTFIDDLNRDPQILNLDSCNKYSVELSDPDSRDDEKQYLEEVYARGGERFYAEANTSYHIATIDGLPVIEKYLSGIRR